eukprot:TRINITY_DN20154_c0_g1_i1.p1 TRINITY_DN20154_c0_g1~~TRINITY_DN20154_c0_g1_i1.p1  ORF type:complete len:300 (+),score=68.19 TRINITY_DN20154_c0_g1_i1:37-936(+)
MLAASLLLTAVLGSLKIWEDEASSGVDKKEFTISSAGASVAEVNKDMQGKRSMDKNGMLRVDGVLDKKECETMLGKVEEIKPRQTKGNHHYNLPVVMDEAVQKICVTIIDKLYRTIKDTLGPDALLVAMGIMVNDPGAKYQKWHADTIPEKDVAKLYTYFVALEDVEDLMGPTGLVTGSHKGEWLSQCEKEITAAKRAPCSKLIDSSAKVSATLSQGDILIMDSTTQHRANANLSKKRRRLFYFSLTGPGRLPDGSTYTLHKGYKSAKLTLRNYRNWHKTDPALPNGNKRFVGYESGEM